MAKNKKKKVEKTNNEKENTVDVKEEISKPKKQEDKKENINSKKDLNSNKKENVEKKSDGKDFENKDLDKNKKSSKSKSENQVSKEKKQEGKKEIVKESKKEDINKQENEKIESKKNVAKKSEKSKKVENKQSDDVKKVEIKEDKEEAKDKKKEKNKKTPETSKEKKQDKVEKSEEKNKKVTKTESNKAKTKSEQKSDKPDYVVDENKKRKNRWTALIVFICIAIIIMIFSTIFAFLNISSNKIAKGVSVKNIDLSGLTIEEAKNKLSEALNIELNVALELDYQDFKTTFDTNQIEYSYKIDDAVTEAYEVGRDKSLIENNYNLLKANLFGNNLEINSNYNEESLSYIVKDIGTKVPGLVEEPSYYKEGKELVIEKGNDGIEVNSEQLKNNILEDIKNRNANEIQADTTARKIDIPVNEKKASAIDIDKIYSEVRCEPKDAYYETDPFKIYKEEDGVDFAISVDEAKEKISSEDKTEYRIPLKLTPAKKTINDIGTEAFPYKISEFPTRYDATNTNRSQNLSLATGKINGTVLMPGETFSFNQVVGKRTIDAGYKDAKIYENGKVVDGLAGGICQVSSTLYNAVLLANLEIIERTNHSFTTSYVKAGRDATVVYGVKDFQFKNNRNYPIKIEGSVGSGILTFKIHGIKEETEYEVKIVPYTTGTIPYTTQTITDASLQPGETVVEQSGHAGCKVTTYKQLWLNGTMVSNELLSNDTYNAMQTIIRVGPTN